MNVSSAAVNPIAFDPYSAGIGRGALLVNYISWLIGYIIFSCT
jgi:hypothetical protein